MWMETCESLIPHLAVTALRATVLLVLALGAALLMRRAPAAARHRVWTAVTLALILLPFCGLLPRVSLQVLPPPAVVTGPDAVLTDPPAIPWTPPPRAVTPTPLRAEPPVLALVAASAQPRWPVALVGIWFVGAAVMLRRSIVARRRAGRLVARTARADLAVWPAAGLDVREGDEVELPMTVRALRPVILVPAQEGRRWSAAWRAAVVEHEAAHVRRRDPLWQLVCEVACALYWFHPLVWLAARQLRIERELAADDDVLARGQRPSDYAELLVTLGCLPAMVPGSGAVLPILTQSGLKARLLGIIDARRRRGLGRRARLALAAVGLCVFLPTASAVLVRRAPEGTQFYPGALLACARDQDTRAPLAAADVDLWDGTSVVERVRTDRDGCFRTSRGAPRSGQIIAYVRKGAIAGRKGMLSGKYGTQLPTTIDVRRAHVISGIARDGRGVPLAGATVRVVWSPVWAAGPGPDGLVVSGPDGRFAFDGLLYGTHRLLFQAPSGAMATALVKVAESDVGGLDVVVPDPWPVTGHLKDGSGRAVAGARVEEAYPFPREPGRAVRGRHIDWDVTDDTGAFRLVQIGRPLLATGRDAEGTLLLARFSDYRSAEGRFRNLPAGGWQVEPPASADIVMRPAGVVSGQVHLPDGRPAPFAGVQALVRVDAGDAVNTIRQSRADGDGRFVLGPLPLGEVEIYAFTRAGTSVLHAIRRHHLVHGESDPPLEIVLETR
jgi:beta-lactamase regulating signal transducer with metallopeptidase domain